MKTDINTLKILAASRGFSFDEQSESFGDFETFSQAEAFADEHGLFLYYCKRKNGCDWKRENVAAGPFDMAAYHFGADYDVIKKTSDSDASDWLETQGLQLLQDLQEEGVDGAELDSWWKIVMTVFEEIDKAEIGSIVVTYMGEYAETYGPDTAGFYDEGDGIRYEIRAFAQC